MYQSLRALWVVIQLRNLSVAQSMWLRNNDIHEVAKSPVRDLWGGF